MDYLVQRANRHDADRVIVGEVLGDEIVPMLNAMTAGKAGSMCTIHADSTEGTFGKIKTYASQSPKHLSDNAAAQLTAQALDLVIFVRKRPDSLWSGPALRVLGARGGGLRGPPRHLDRDLRRTRGRWTGRPPPLHAAGTARPAVGLRLRGPPPPGVRTMTPVVVLFGAGIGVGLALVISGIWSSARPAGRLSVTKRIDPANRQAAACAVILAAIVGLVTHWPVGAAIGGAVGWTLRSALQPTTSRRVVDRLEALATWIEALRDSVAAHRGLLAAIESTERSAPPAIKAPVARLIVRIKSGTALDAALYAFAAELGDAAADEAIAPLILAARFGGSDLGGLLGQRGSEHTRADRALATHRGGPVQTTA